MNLLSTRDSIFLLNALLFFDLAQSDLLDFRSEKPHKCARKSQDSPAKFTAKTPANLQDLVPSSKPQIDYQVHREEEGEHSIKFLVIVQSINQLSSFLKHHHQNSLFFIFQHACLVRRSQPP